MKLFADTANLQEIERSLEQGIIQGITTNPSLMAKEPRSEYLVHLKKIVALAKAYGGNYSLSVEVFSEEPREMIAQAEQFVHELDYAHLAVKVHVSHGGASNFRVVRELARRGLAVNCTACMTPMQAALAAASGARYVSLFYNRIRDGATDSHTDERQQALAERVIEETDFSPDQVIRESRQLLAEHPAAEIIVGSIRTVLDIKHAALAGADIVTASPKLFVKAYSHYKTDEAVEQFLNDFARWRSEPARVREILEPVPA
jgi:transaldolase